MGSGPPPILLITSLVGPTGFLWTEGSMRDPPKKVEEWSQRGRRCTFSTGSLGLLGKKTVRLSVTGRVHRERESYPV